MAELVRLAQGLAQPHLAMGVADLHQHYLDYVYTGLAAFFGATRAPIPTPQAIALQTQESLRYYLTLSPPQGVFYLVVQNDTVVGMGGLRRLRPNCVEVKRLYIAPAQRGAGLGAQLLGQLLLDAKNWGYPRVVLDSTPFMHSSHRLYQRFGFTDCPAYEGTDAPLDLHDHWRFMAKATETQSTA